MIRIPVWLRLALAAVVLGGALLLVGRGQFRPDELNAVLAAYGAWMPLVFVAFHTVLTIMFVPRLVMGTAAGIAFGFWSGLLWSMLGAMAGSLVGFWIARYVKGDAIVVEDMPRLGPLLERAQAGGWRTVMAARLIPFIPNPVLNYALGLTRVGVADYALGSVLGMLPTGVAYANFGASGRYALGGNPGWVEPLAWSAALLALALLLPRLMQRWIKP